MASSASLVRTRFRTVSGSSASFPFSASLLTDHAMDFAAFSSWAGWESTRVTSCPAWAETWAMPLPMNPAPTTATRLIGMARDLLVYRHDNGGQCNGILGVVPRTFL